MIEITSTNFKKVLLLFLFVILPSIGIFAQSNKTVTGVIQDNTGVALPGATVQIVGNDMYGTVSDQDGRYAIQVGANESSVLRFSYLGYITQEIAIGSRSELNVQLESDSQNLEEVVVVGFGTQKRVSITGAVTSVKADDLPTTSTSSLATALTGRLPGTVIVQNSGMAGAQAADISIRGSSNNPLILVDGIERSFEDLDMDEVESISVLKDASATAVYGIRGGDGVIIITTKRGQEGKFKVNLKAEFGLVQQGQAAEMLNSYDYARLRNLGQINDAIQDGMDPSTITPYYSDSAVEFYRNGKSPVLYPSSNWTDMLLNKFGYHQRYNVSISGGNDFFRTYTTIGYMNERDTYRDYDVGYDDRSMYQRYNIRSNIDFDLTKSTVLSVDIGGQFANTNQPNVDFNGANGLVKEMFLSPPNTSTFYNGMVVLQDSGSASPIYQIYDVGYKDKHNNKLQFSAKVAQKLDFITKGLTIDASVSYDHAFSNSYTSSHTPQTHVVGYINDDMTEMKGVGSLTADPETGLVQNPYTNEWGEVGVLSDGIDGKMGSSRSSDTQARNINFKTRLGYNRSFNKHNVGAMGVFTTNSSNYFISSSSSSFEDEYGYVPRRYIEMAARVSYNYDYRYFIEVNAGYNGSETFHEDNRFGFFPAISGGWVPSEEKFFPKNDILTFLKFRGSYGTTGIDSGPTRFMYFDGYSIGGGNGYMFGETGGGLGESTMTPTSNPLVSWATNYQRNVAIETKWFGNRLNINADFYRNNKKGIMMAPLLTPSIVGTTFPAANLKEIQYEGYELQASWQDNIGEFKYDLFANYNYADAKNIYIDEVTPPYDWQRKTGRHPNLLDGYKCVGFYTEEDIAQLYPNGGNEASGATPSNPASSFEKGRLQPGDLKYADLNGDGIVNTDDKMSFENTYIPKSTFGFGGGLKWRNLGFDVFFQGATDVTYVLSGYMRTPFSSGVTNGADYITQHWSPERVASGEDILFPRMTSVSNKNDHNFQDSNFWMHDASYIRLKNASISYSLHSKGLDRLGVNKIDFTLSGTNLWTWSTLDIVDPETKSGDTAPIPPNRVYTLGINIGF